MTKKLFIKTYGCQMNVYDSARMSDVLAPIGYGPCDDADDADLIILNTCHIREKAAEKVFSELGRMNQIKTRRRADGSNLILAVAGCVAQAEGEEIMRRAPYVDMVFGPQTYHRLPEMVARATRAANPGKRGRILDIDFPDEVKFDSLPAPTAAGETSAFLSIQEGCDNFCTFCVVPYTRGAEYSRPVADIAREATGLVAEGVCEITLLGQNVNAYHGVVPNGGPDDTWGLGSLIRELAKIDGLDRIRYITSHPADVDDDLIRAHGDIEQLMPFLHLPIQSGSDRILAAMNRRHSADDYLKTVAKLRAVRPDLALSSDFIVGFPGETDADFQATLKMVDEIKFIQAYSFKYSPRPGTPAAAMEYQVPEEVKAERLAILQARLSEHQVEFNQSCVGREFDVLLDRRGKEDNQLVGRSPYMQPVHVTAPAELLGQVVALEIVDGRPNSLSGRLIDQAAAPMASRGAA